MDRTRQSGFTLTELVITLVVLAILAVVSVPNYVELRERQALRGAAENFQAALGLAKQEAIKRGALVRVEFHPVGDGVCVGAVVVDAPDDAGCNCSTTACDVASFPETVGDTGDLRRVTLDDDIAFGADGNGFVIDPRTGTLFDVADTGGFSLVTGSGYEVAVDVNIMARASLCTPSGSEKSLAGVRACD